MKISWCLLPALLALLPAARMVATECPNAEKDPNDKATILTFYIEQEAEQAEDFIEMSFTILEKDNSLRKAIDKVKNNMKSIQGVATSYCTKNGGTDCENCIEVGKHKIAPIYQVIRREPLFSGKKGIT